MKIVYNVLFCILSLILIVYVSLPVPSYPGIPSNSLQSEERGDTEDFKNRRAYFTDHSREEVLRFHTNELNKITLNGMVIPLLTYRLNYPPEDAMIYIKELTRSWYLEEIVHPFRESFFVNGFVPQAAKDAIIIDGREFQQKVSIRYYRSPLIARFGLIFASLILIYVLAREWYKTIFVRNYD